MTKKPFRWLKRNFRVIIRDEGNLRELSVVRAVAFKLIFVGFFFFLLLCTIILSAGWWGFQYYREHNDPTVLLNKRVVSTSRAIDSLEGEIAGNNQYIKSLYAVLGGDIEYLSDEEGGMPQGAPSEPHEGVTAQLLTARAGRDKEEKERASAQFFLPITGYVTDKFNAKIEHFGVDIAAKNDEPVKAMGDGTVVFSSWTQDGGYVIAIQHHNHFVSVYKHNTRLLKRFGSYVSAGEPISFMGNTGALTSGPHLHLELWWRGMPLDPELFVNF